MSEQPALLFFRAPQPSRRLQAYLLENEVTSEQAALLALSETDEEDIFLKFLAWCSRHGWSWDRRNLTKEK